MAVTDGYKRITDAGQARTAAPGTETANEGKGASTKWAKRKSEGA